MAAISIERNQLQDSIENLFEGFVKASVQLIEARDLSTYGHSERVAEISVRLSQEINTVTEGSLRSVKFSDKQIQEIRYAALLHDFGEVCVPESILQRRQKLSSEQLEIIRQRFAVAQRTLELETAQNKLQAIQNTGDRSSLEKLDRFLTQAVQKMNKFWEIIVKINEPEASLTREFQPFSDEELERLTELSQYTYPDLDGEPKHLITSQEMARLMIPRGNLTPAERSAVEAHVTHSYQFLQRIPWTTNLKAIPRIVHAHHEKPDGTGYPQGLEETAIPIQSQILAIADIYDALTAGDRPFKQGLPIHTTLAILKATAAQNKLNRDLVQLFDQRQVYEVLDTSRDK